MVRGRSPSSFHHTVVDERALGWHAVAAIENGGHRITVISVGASLLCSQADLCRVTPEMKAQEFG